MNSLLLVAHGSRRRESNEEIGRLAARVAERAGDRFAVVEHAFLELAEPSIGDGIERCIARGATEVTVLPYFLARGTHVAEDVPGEVEPKRAEHPGVRIRIADYLGTSEALPDLLVGLASAGSATGAPAASAPARIDGSAADPERVAADVAGATNVA